MKTPVTIQIHGSLTLYSVRPLLRGRSRASLRRLGRIGWLVRFFSDAQHGRNWLNPYRQKKQKQNTSLEFKRFFWSRSHTVWSCPRNLNASTGLMPMLTDVYQGQVPHVSSQAVQLQPFLLLWNRITWDEQQVQKVTLGSSHARLQAASTCSTTQEESSRYSKFILRWLMLACCYCSPSMV